VTILEVHADVSRIADSLEKLVFLLEKLVFPPPPPDLKVEQATLDDLRYVGEEEILKMQREKQALAERFNVIADSPAFVAAAQQWEIDQRRIHGEAWEPPDWRGVYQSARSQQGDGGEPAPAQAAQEQGT
jgi:hypothetical protein